MSKLDELIADLCPNGVVFLPIEKCVEKIDNKKWTLASEETYQYIDLTSVDRNTHLISDTQMINKDNAPSRAQQIVVEGDILLGTTRPMLKRYCMVNQEYDRQICSTGFCVLRAKSAVILNRWLYHQISSTAFFDHVERFQKGTSYPAISDADVKSYAIPVPPLHVQSEIVAILDNFTELAAELTTELTAELTARKKQYEYYRNELLTFGDDVEWKMLGEIGRVAMCKRIMKAQTSPIGDIPFYKIGTFGKEPDAYISKEIFDEYKTKYSFPKVGDILISASGTIGRTVVYNGKPAYYQDSNIVWLEHDEKNILNKYLEYCYQLKPWNISTGGTISRLYNDNILKAKIPVPPLEEQQRIIEILDRFDTLVNDITIGLPAEIAARQKQYEFYRDKLLTFKELA